MAVPSRTPMFDANGNLTRPWTLFFDALDQSNAGGSSGGIAGASSQDIAAAAPVFATTLNGSISSGATSAVLTSISGLPTAPYYLNIGIENVLVTGLPSGSTVPIVRGQNGTLGTVHASGEVVRSVVLVTPPTDATLFVVTFTQDATGYRDQPIFQTGAGNFVDHVNVASELKITGIPDSIAVWTFAQQASGLWIDTSFVAGRSLS